MENLIPPSHTEGPAPDGSFARPRITDLTTTLAMNSLHQCQRPFTGALTADDMLLELHNALVHDTDGQTMLFTHAQTLNALFHRLIARAVDCPDPQGNPTLYVSDRMTVLALTAQKQCLQTLAGLAALRALEKNAVQTIGGKE